jgi:hypothetical protein
MLLKPALSVTKTIRPCRGADARAGERVAGTAVDAVGMGDGRMVGGNVGRTGVGAGVSKNAEEGGVAVVFKPAALPPGGGKMSGRLYKKRTNKQVPRTMVIKTIIVPSANPPGRRP